MNAGTIYTRRFCVCRFCPRIKGDELGRRAACAAGGGIIKLKTNG